MKQSKEKSKEKSKEQSKGTSKEKPAAVGDVQSAVPVRKSARTAQEVRSATGADTLCARFTTVYFPNGPLVTVRHFQGASPLAEFSEDSVEERRIT